MKEVVMLRPAMGTKSPLDQLAEEHELEQLKMQQQQQQSEDNQQQHHGNN